MSDRQIVTRKEAMAMRLKYYFTGKPCPNGHIDMRHVGGGCVPCERERVRLRNGEKYRSDPEYRDMVKAQSKARIRQIYSNPEDLSEEMVRARQRYHSRRNSPERRERDRKDWRIRKREYAVKNPNEFRIRNSIRRSRIVCAGGSYTSQDITEILDAQNHICVYCKVDLTSGYHIDHIMPLALGGSNWPSNIQCLCPTCNLSKGAKHPDDFAKEKGRDQTRP